jgi:hypothetical protein
MFTVYETEEVSIVCNEIRNGGPGENHRPVARH